MATINFYNNQLFEICNMKKASSKTKGLSGPGLELQAEAKRYLSNAVEILKTKGKVENNYYTDKKYVKMASHTAYTGVLYALDNTLKMPKKIRNHEQEYVKALAMQNRKMATNFNRVYDILHLSGGYDGNGDLKTLRSGFEAANELIDWCASRVGKK